MRNIPTKGQVWKKAELDNWSTSYYDSQGTDLNIKILDKLAGMMIGI